MPKIITTLAVPTEHPCYADHFLGNPIVPGALILQWLCNLIHSRMPELTIREIKSSKFLNPLLPGEQCEVQIEHAPEQQHVVVFCKSNDKPICQCRLSVESGKEVNA